VASTDDVEEALQVVTAAAADLRPEVVSDKNEAKRLALAIDGRLPVIYGGPVTGAVAYRWKTDLEENAKRLAVAGVLPEMNHNEIEVWGGGEAQGLHAVLLRDGDEPAEIVSCASCSIPRAAASARRGRADRAGSPGSSRSSIWDSG
jgi:glucose/mannose-6-phosphate isomerase